MLRKCVSVLGVRNRRVGRVQAVQTLCKPW